MAHPTEDKNFRLPPTIRPRRYRAELTLQPHRRQFSGAMKLELRLEKPTHEVVLHQIGLRLHKVSYRAGAQEWAASEVRPVPASETVVLRFAQPLPSGEGELELEWEGQFSSGLRGLYLAGEVMSTQFEAADARRLFPCFDEPAFKARWALTLDVPAGLTTLSNGHETFRERRGDRERVGFAETELLSSYLLAIASGNLAGCVEQRVDGVAVRTWATADKVHLTGFGQEVAVAVLPRLREYFGLPYGFGKLDQVGVPDFEAGAMENAGLVIYRELLLLVDPKTAPLLVQKRAAEVITHELAHQWFGNWVTMMWWDDLWLNEAFATWMAYKIVDQWKPGWRMWLNFDASKASALSLDALKSTHPIRGEVKNAGEAGENFDVITYEKGGAVLRMIEGFLGEATFREGIRAYMVKHGRANAVADDLWGALAAASRQPVVELANGWINQSGFPLVSVTVNGRTATLTQSRFYSEPEMKSDELWPVPMVLRFKDAQGVHTQRVLLQGRRAEVALEGAGDIVWLCANAGATGFYRVAYDRQGLSALALHRGELEAAERIALLADQWAQVRSNQAPIEDFLGLAARFGDEEDDAVLDELVGRLSAIDHRLIDESDRPLFQRWVQKLFGPQLARVGWDGPADEPDEVRLRRAALVRAVGLVGNEPGVVKEAHRRILQVLSGQGGALENNLLDVGMSLAARAGDEALFRQLEERVVRELDPAFKRRILSGLTAFDDPVLIERSQQLLFTERVAMQEISSYVSGLMSNRRGRSSAWRLLQTRWSDVLQRTGGGPMLIKRVVESMGYLVTPEELTQAKALLEGHPLEEAKNTAQQTIERLAQDVAFRERVRAKVSSWLRQSV